MSTLQLVGRAAEQSVLWGWFQRLQSSGAQEGHGGLIGDLGGGIALLTGPAGIGKTTLARWLVAEVRRTGASALMVAATSSPLEPPLGIWRRLSVATSAASAASATSAQAPVSRPRAVTEGDWFDPAAPEPHADDALTVRTYRAALGLLARLGPGPAVVVLDDLHGADEDSLRLLAQLRPVLHELPVLVLAVLRGPDSHPAELGRRALASLLTTPRQLTLGGFDDEDVVALLEFAGGGRSDRPGLRTSCRHSAMSGRCIMPPGCATSRPATRC